MSGKSCLLKAFMGDPFKGVYTSTIGVDFEIKPMVVNGKTVNLQIVQQQQRPTPSITYKELH